MVCVSALFDQVHQACTQLDELADRRLNILNQRLLLAVFEEETADVSVKNRFMKVLMVLNANLDVIN